VIVAALCFRQGPGGLQVLLVRTGDGRRWAFPQGSARPGEEAPATALRALTAQSGWRGRTISPSLLHWIAPAGLARFVALAVAPAGRAGTGEGGRVPSWFPLTDASEKLAENRAGPAAARLVVILTEAAALFRRQAEHAAAGA